jgi:hypothetical protein
VTQTYRDAHIEVGDRFGRWVVIDIPDLIEDRYPNGQLHHPRWLCLCDCGTRRLVTGGNLLGGHSRSCGCATAESAALRFRTHGQAGTRLHQVWGNMIQRCHNPANERYGYYGGRGIRVCEEWEDFAMFRDWALKAGYREGLTIERLDNDGDYEPGNCTWTTRQRQARNRRTNRFLTAFGEVKTVADWAEDPRCQVGYYTLHSRLGLGWPSQRAISMPARSRGKPAA